MGCFPKFGLFPLKIIELPYGVSRQFLELGYSAEIIAKKFW